jgi:amino acid transporter
VSVLVNESVSAATGRAALFPARSHLPVGSSWWSGVLVATGGSLMVAVSLGPMAADLGNASVWIWVVTAAIGGTQCLLIAELATRFPERAGGTPQFAYRAVPRGSATTGALSAWCYWFAWTPGIAVNLILAATYLRGLLWPQVNPVLLAAVLGAVLYVVTAMGLRLSTMVSSVLAVMAVAVILVIIAGPIVRPGEFQAAEVFPVALPATAPHDAGGVLALVLKWGFVATWASYAAEMASTVCAEIRQPERFLGRSMMVSAGVCFVVFSAVPIALFGLVGIDGVQQDPFEVFEAAGTVLLGPSGTVLVGLGLAAVLVLGAEAFIIGSSRTIYQMARDGHLPSVFARTNRRGAPVGSIAWDFVVIGIMLLVFGTDVVDVVAAANVGYLIVFILLPIAYLVLRRHPDRPVRGFRLGRPFVAVAVLLALFNAVLLVAGGAQWGWRVMLVGFGVSLLILPISLVTRRLTRAAASTDAILPAVNP